MKRLSYIREGSRYPLVLQHGYLGGAEMWCAQIDHFKSGYDVIDPILAGFWRHGSMQTGDEGGSA